MDLSTLSGAMEDEQQAGKWLLALGQLQARLMPPLRKERPQAAAQRRVIRWIESTLIKSGHGATYQKKMALPQYGNWVDHHSLFSGEFDEPPFTEARLWRNSPYIFSAKRVLNKRVRGIQNPFTYSTPENGVRDYASTSAVGASVIETSLLNAASEIDWLFADALHWLAQPADAKGSMSCSKMTLNRASTIGPPPPNGT